MSSRGRSVPTPTLPKFGGNGDENVVRKLNTMVGDIERFFRRMLGLEDDVENLTTRVTTAESNITDNDSDITLLTSRISSAETNITGNDTDIAALDTRLTTAETNITGNDGDISSLDTRVTSLENTDNVTGDGTTGGSASPSETDHQYVELTVNGTTYKVLHDGTV